MIDPHHPQQDRTGAVEVPVPGPRRRSVLLAVGYAVLGVLAVVSLVGLVVDPAPIFLIDAVAAVYGLWALAHYSRRRPGDRAT